MTNEKSAQNSYPPVLFVFRRNIFLTGSLSGSGLTVTDSGEYMAAGRRYREEPLLSPVSEHLLCLSATDTPLTFDALLLLFLHGNEETRMAVACLMARDPQSLYNAFADGVIRDRDAYLLFYMWICPSFLPADMRGKRRHTVDFSAYATEDAVLIRLFLLLRQRLQATEQHFSRTVRACHPF